MKKPTIKFTLTSLGLVGLTTLFTCQAQASPLANDAFDQYGNGTAITASGNWIAFSGAGNLPLTTSSGAVTVTDVASGTSGEDDRITFASTPQTGVFYYSTLVTVPTGTAPTAAGDYFFSGYSTASGYLGRVFVASSGTNVVFGLTNQGTTVSGLTAQQSAAITLGSEYRLVLRVDTTAHTATLGVQLATDPAFTADSQLTITGGAAGTIASLDSVAIRQGSGGTYTLADDGVEAGTTLANVASIATGPSAFFNANAVPEPSTYAALGMGLLALVGVQRMRRRAA